MAAGSFTLFVRRAPREGMIYGSVAVRDPSNRLPRYSYHRASGVGPRAGQAYVPNGV